MHLALGVLMASQGAHMHTHTHTRDKTGEICIYTHTHTQTGARGTFRSTRETQACASCTCTVVHALMRMQTHTVCTNKKTKKAPNSHPCYFCSFRINLMDRMSGGITTDWWNQDTKCSTERDTLHCSTRGTSTHTHTHTHTRIHDNSYCNRTHTCM